MISHLQEAIFKDLREISKVQEISQDPLEIFLVLQEISRDLLGTFSQGVIFNLPGEISNPDILDQEDPCAHQWVHSKEGQDTDNLMVQCLDHSGDPQDQ